MTTLRDQLVEQFAARLAKRGVDRVAVAARVHESGTCEHGGLLWRRCGACGSDGLSDDVIDQILAFRRVADKVTSSPAEPLQRADVAALRGVAEETVRSQQRAYPAGDANEFPQPAGKIGRAPYWNPEHALALASWNGVGQGAGGGRRPHAAPRAHAESADAVPAAHQEMSA